MLRGAGSLMSLFSLDSKERAEEANDRGEISGGGGAKISWPLISLNLASDICFLLFISASLCNNVPLNSRCLATSGIDVGFLGEILSSSALNDIWLIPLIVC